MLLSNHVAPGLVLTNPENKLTCWVQNKRLFKDLVRINLHEGTELRMPNVIKVFLSSSPSNLSALPSIVAMKGVNDPNPPTQATKIKKVSKSKSKITPGVSQKAHVVKTSKSQLVRSDQVSKVGEGIGGNQETLKDKAGEGVINQPNHVAFSQKGCKH